MTDSEKGTTMTHSGQGKTKTDSEKGQLMTESDLDLNKIITETEDIAWNLKMKIDKQKHEVIKLQFILSKINESIQLYTHHRCKLNSFYINNDRLQSTKYLECCEKLPSYGDYAKVLMTDSTSPIQVAGASSAIPEGELKQLVETVADTFYAYGTNIKIQRTVCKNMAREDRETSVSEFETGMPIWLQLFQAESEKLIAMDDKLFQTLAYINFLRTGEYDAPLTLDLTSTEDLKCSEAKAPPPKESSTKEGDKSDQAADDKSELPPPKENLNEDDKSGQAVDDKSEPLPPKEPLREDDTSDQPLDDKTVSRKPSVQDEPDADGKKISVQEEPDADDKKISVLEEPDADDKSKSIKPEDEDIGQN